MPEGGRDGAGLFLSLEKFLVSCGILGGALALSGFSLAEESSVLERRQVDRCYKQELGSEGTNQRGNVSTEISGRKELSN